MEIDIRKIKELEEDSDAILEFLSQCKKRVGEIEIVLSIVMAKFMLNAMCEINEKDGKKGLSLDISTLLEYKNRVFGMIESIILPFIYKNKK